MFVGIFVTCPAGCSIFRELRDGRGLHEATFLCYCALSLHAKTVRSFTNTVPLCSNLIVGFKRWVNVAGTLLSSLVNAAVVFSRKGKWFSACDLLTRTGQ